MKRAGRNLQKRTRRLYFQSCEARQLMAADVPFGATPIDTGEFLLGSITVTPVFFESDGSIDPDTENWDAQEIDATLSKIDQSLQWWSDLLATQTSVHTLDWVIDDTYAKNPVETGYEPISRTSNVFQRYVGNWLTDLGYGDAPSIERAVHLFNDSQRQTHQTDWAFTVFVVDASNDADGYFAQGGFIGAFAYAGGLFVVIPNGRPVSTFTHEMGHIFWARDEYPGAGSWTDKRGYYNAQNINAADNPTPGWVQQTSIMRGGASSVEAFNQGVTDADTLAMIGWLDSDNDGIFDVADVPLQLDAIATFDQESQAFSIQGTAAVDTLANKNSEGPQSDITLARIRELQYRLDNGDWQTALTSDDTSVNFDLDVPVTSQSTLEFRAIDTATGITSEVLSASTLVPAFSGLGGVYAFLDSDANGVRNGNEVLLSGVALELKKSDGSDLDYTEYLAATIDSGIVEASGDWVLSAIGEDVDGRIGNFDSTSETGFGKVLQAFDTHSGSWKDSFGSDRQLQATSSVPTGEMTIDFVATDLGGYGFEGGSYARVTAYDSSGELIDRVTSNWIEAGQSGQLVVSDPKGRIAKVVVAGHAETEILISAIRFGQQSIGGDTNQGILPINNLPIGQYELQTHSSNVIYQFDSAAIPLQIDASMGSIGLAVKRVDSPRYNAETPTDVNGDGIVSVRDALAVINDLGRLGSRTLTSLDPSGFHVDVNNDGIVSPIDALAVINYLGRQSAQGEGELVADASGEGESTQEIDPSTADFLYSLHSKQENAWNSLDGQREFFGQNITEKSTMLNSAGKQTSDASAGDPSSDSLLQADVAEGASTSLFTDFEGIFCGNLQGFPTGSLSDLSLSRRF